MLLRCFAKIHLVTNKKWDGDSKRQQNFTSEITVVRIAVLTEIRGFCLFSAATDATKKIKS